MHGVYHMKLKQIICESKVDYMWRKNKKTKHIVIWMGDKKFKNAEHET